MSRKGSTRSMRRVISGVASHKVKHKTNKEEYVRKGNEVFVSLINDRIILKIVYS